jgi:putative holliday junction resolvase
VTRARKAVLAIDHGTKRCGFALTDALRITTQPLDPFRGAGDSPQLLDAIAALLRERDVEAFLLGMPFNMDGTSGPRASDVQRFRAALEQRFPSVRVIPYDERLTTKAAEELLREAGHRGAEARARRDSWSALVLLRDWLASGEPGNG